MQIKLIVVVVVAWRVPLYSKKVEKKKTKNLIPKLS